MSDDLAASSASYGSLRSLSGLGKSDPAIVAQHRAWLDAYLLHRKKEVVLKGELKGKRKETRSVALSAGEACNYEPLDRQLA